MIVKNERRIVKVERKLRMKEKRMDEWLKWGKSEIKWKKNVEKSGKEGIDNREKMLRVVEKEIDREWKNVEVF